MGIVCPVPRLLLALAALPLVACAPASPALTPQHARHAALAADVDWAEASITARDGTALYVQRWRPTTGAPKAIVAIHHGLADHSDRYAELATALVHAGYAVWAFDMRGHGRSAGPRVAMATMDTMLDDVDAFLAHVRAQDPNLPIYLYGHSIGGLITCLYTIERVPDAHALAGVILAAPALAFDAPPLQAGAIRTIAALAPDAPILDTPHREFSRRDDVVAEMDRDPWIGSSGPARTARTAVDGVARVWAAPEHFRVPLLALHGTADHLTAPAGSRDLVARAGTADKTLRIYPGLVHDLLREPDGGGARVTADVLAWLDAHAAGTPAQLPPLAAPPAHLAGDASGRALAVELDLRGELARSGDDRGLTGGARVRFGLGRAGALGLGYVGGLDVRGGSVGGAEYEVDAHALGLAVRALSGAQLAVTGGIGIGGVRGATATHAPIELALDVPAGPLHLLARAALGYRVSGARYATRALGALGADEASALVGVRLGRDVRYWGTTTSGAGPFVAATYRDLGGARLVGLVIGVDLGGGN